MGSTGSSTASSTTARWSERAARALEGLAAVYEDRGRAGGLRDVAREIRAQIGSASADWVKTD